MLRTSKLAQSFVQVYVLMLIKIKLKVNTFEIKNEKKSIDHWIPEGSNPPSL